MISTTQATAPVLEEQTLTAPEKEQALLLLEQTRNGIQGALRGLSEAQWNFKPNQERWSTAEIVQHVIDVQERILGPIRDQLAQAPSTTPHADHRRVDEIILARIPSRLNKFPSPIQPVRGLTRSEALERVRKNYTRLNQYLESTPDLRHHVIESAPLKAISGGSYTLMDGYQWILAVALHTERHTKQILELMADADFPAD